MTRSKPTGRLSASGRARVVAWILGVSALGMVLMLVSIVLTLRWVERDAIETSLTQESDEVAVFAQNGRDPETGEPFATPERFVGHYLERQRVEPTELMFGGTAAAPVIAQIHGDAAVPVELLAPATRQAMEQPRSRGTLVDPTHGRISYANLTVTTPADTGHVVVAVFHERYEQRVMTQTLLLSVLALAALAATAAAAWLVSSRILGHTVEFHRAVDASLKDRGLRRLPENGSEEYAGLARRANDLVRRADRRLEEERRFAEDVTFALRTPLTVIEGGLRNPGGDEQERRTSYRHIGAEATRVRGLLEDLVILSRLQQDDVVLERTPVDVGVLVATAAQAWRERHPDAADEPRLDVEAPAEGLTAVTDRARLVQVLEELLDNARHAVRFAPGSDLPRDLTAVTPLECTLSVRVREEERDGEPWAVVEVADRGRGIPEEDREEVFERLANASNDPYPGNGLGLPVAALLSTALDGELTLEPGPGAAGTVARLAVPLTADQDGEDA